MEINTENDDEEIHLYLDFGNKVREEVFQNKLFLRIANLGSKNPLIQLNDQLFRGEYEDCVGTNIFFEKVDSTSKDSLFRNSNVRLKPTVTQFKTLCLESVNLPSNLKDIPEPDYDIQINGDYEYATLLKKLSDGTLNIEDDLKIVPKNSKQSEVKAVIEPVERSTATEEPKKTSPLPHKESNVEKLKETVIEPIIEPVVETKNRNRGSKKEKNDTLKMKYEKLRKLARRPTRRKIEVENIEKCDPKFQEAYDYNSIKSQIIKPSDHFRTISREFDENSLVGAVDIDRSVLQGVIKPPTNPSSLSVEEKSALLSMENLENLSIYARFCVLKSQLDHLETSISNMTEEEQISKNEYGRSVRDTLRIYKRLVNVLNGLVQSNYCYNSEEEDDL